MRAMTLHRMNGAMPTFDDPTYPLNIFPDRETAAVLPAVASVSRAQINVLIALAILNLLVLVVVLVFCGYTFYVVHHTVEAFRTVVGQWVVR